jgi:hypothetical protein
MSSSRNGTGQTATRKKHEMSDVIACEGLVLVFEGENGRDDGSV